MDLHDVLQCFSFVFLLSLYCYDVGCLFQTVTELTEERVQLIYELDIYSTHVMKLNLWLKVLEMGLNVITKQLTLKLTSFIQFWI